MSAQTATSEAVQWATEQHPKYEPSSETKQKLSKISLGMVIGPTSVGKSFLIDKVTETNERFSNMGTITTRAKRETDPDSYRHVPVDDFTAMIESGELVQYAIHPTTGDFYGSDTDSFPTDLVVAPVLVSGRGSFIKAGFKRITPIGIVCPADEWVDRLAVHTDSEDLIKRLYEARQVLQWLRGNRLNSDVAILNNNSGGNAVNANIASIEYLTMGKDKPYWYHGTENAEKLIDEMQATAWHKLEELSDNEQE